MTPHNPHPARFTFGIVEFGMRRIRHPNGVFEFHCCEAHDMDNVFDARTFTPADAPDGDANYVGTLWAINRCGALLGEHQPS